MSIATEITRIQTAKADLKTAIEGKGVTVPSATKIDGYASLVSSIPSSGGSTLITKNISENGTYNASSDSADGYSQVTVAVPASAVDTGTKSITANGTHDVVGYASASVAVPNSYSASDEGKVVDNGELAAQTAHADVTPTTSDQTIDTTTNNSIKVKGDADLVAGNIKKDVEIFGVTGSYEGGGGGGDLEAFMTREISDYEDDYTIGIPARFIGGSFPNLKRIRLNNATYFGGSPYYQFQVIGRSDLVIVLPKCTNMIINCCNGSTSLNVLDFLGGSAASIQQQVFYGCTNLETLIIRQSDGVMALQNLNAFNNTPFASGKAGGTLYVPSALISDYKAATNWSTILGYTNNNIAAIEGSQYENYYADGTPISA